MKIVVEIINLSTVLNKYGGNSITSNGLMSIATRLQNTAATGLLIIDRPFHEIERWPKEANAARTDAIGLFNKAQRYGSALFNAAERRQAVYVKSQILTIANDLNRSGHAALKQFVLVGADVARDQIAQG